MGVFTDSTMLRYGVQILLKHCNKSVEDLLTLSVEDTSGESPQTPRPEMTPVACVTA